MSRRITFDMRGLDKFARSLDEVPVVSVGILGGGKTRKNDISNAEIGLKHEFGKAGMPMRSFLRIPIAENLQTFLDMSSAFDEATVREVLRIGTIVPWMKKVAIIAEDIVQEAFDTGGYGKWKPSNMKYKKNHQTLVETQQLRNSITSEVKEK